MKLGRYELHLLSDGIFRLDGGTMYGVVPKVLWQKYDQPDEQNRIRMGLNSLLVRTGKRNILIETGIGDRLNRKEQEIYAVARARTLLDHLGDAGLKAADIDMVICTHLHFDHSGWNTVAGEDGRFVPTFPRATYVLQRAEWEAAVHTNIRTRNNYSGDRFLPIEEHGQLRLVEGEEEVDEGLRVILTGGHSDGHQVVRVESDEQVAMFLGDLVPLTSHIRVSYVMSYDLYPMDTVRAKETVLKQALAEEWLLVFVHSPVVGMGRLREEEGRMTVETVERVNYD